MVTLIVQVALRDVVRDDDGRPRLAFLREPDGRDEESVSGTGTLAAIAWLDRLLVEVPIAAAVRPGDAARLTAPERDRLLAAVHRQWYGARIKASPRCRACNEPFELSFDLAAFEASVREEHPRRNEDVGGVYRCEGGQRFRLPTGEDELAMLGLPEDVARRALLERCLVEGDLASDGEHVVAEMNAVAAVLDQELEARCPTCEATFQLRFDVQSYHLGTVRSRLAALSADVHLLAASYGWSYEAISALPRSRRRAYAELADAAATRRRPGG